MDFVFVDETGDTGDESLQGSTPYFGMAAISVTDNDYKTLRLLLSQIHWLRGTATTLALRRTYNKSLDLLRGLKELANHGVISASSLYINKKDYGGRYVKWSDVEIMPSEWPYYLRNYLLRHLLEFHFTNIDNLTDPVDLVLDRILLSESQRRNTLEYLNSETAIPLIEKFRIPTIRFLTIADSEYVGGLEIAHVLAEVLRETIKGAITPEVKAVSDFVRIKHFAESKGKAR
ncbi:MAG: DUF3800 domain-containing protein [Chloroflexi bacterium]|nr:DUF3800 domain-containing protein [Chloroflexota bacterium]